MKQNYYVVFRGRYPDPNGKIPPFEMESSTWRDYSDYVVKCSPVVTDEVNRDQTLVASKLTIEIFRGRPSGGTLDPDNVVQIGGVRDDGSFAAPFYVGVIRAKDYDERRNVDVLECVSIFENLQNYPLTRESIEDLFVLAGYRPEGSSVGVDPLIYSTRDYASRTPSGVEYTYAIVDVATTLKLIIESATGYEVDLPPSLFFDVDAIPYPDRDSGTEPRRFYLEDMRFDLNMLHAWGFEGAADVETVEANRRRNQSRATWWDLLNWTLSAIGWSIYGEAGTARTPAVEIGTGRLGQPFATFDEDFIVGRDYGNDYNVDEGGDAFVARLSFSRDRYYGETAPDGGITSLAEWTSDDEGDDYGSSVVSVPNNFIILFRNRDYDDSSDLNYGDTCVIGSGSGFLSYSKVTRRRRENRSQAWKSRTTKIENGANSRLGAITRRTLNLRDGTFTVEEEVKQ
jgi:hypothetical protein